jgi:hypothetical protein
LEDILKNYSTENLKTGVASLILLQTYSQESKEDLIKILKREQHPETMDQEEKNLVYFYHLINDYLELHINKLEISKDDLRNLTTSNKLVEHLEKIFEEERHREDQEAQNQSA